LLTNIYIRMLCTGASPVFIIAFTTTYGMTIERQFYQKAQSFLVS